MTSREQYLQLIRIVSKATTSARYPKQLSFLAKSDGELGKTYRAVLGAVQRFDRLSRLSRSRLLDNLLGQLFHLDLKKSGLSAASRDFYANSRQLFLMRVLLMLGVRRLGIRIAKRGYDLARKAELTENAIAFVAELRRDAALAGNLKVHRARQAEFDALAKQFAAEQLGNFYVERLTLRFAKSKSAKRHLSKLGLSDATELEALMAINNSLSLRISHLRLKSLAYQIGHDYVSAIRVCEEAIQYLERVTPAVAPIRIGEFYLKRLNCLMLLRKAEDALASIDQAALYFKNSSANQLLLEEYRLLINLQLERWEDARQVLEDVFEGSAIALSGEIVRDRWDVYRLFVNFVNLDDQTRLSQSRKSAEVMISRIGGTIRSDKAGILFSVYLLRILILGRAKDYSALLEAIGSMQAYVYRHIDAKASHRERLLVSFLQRFAKADFKNPESDVRLIELEQRLLAERTATEVTSGFYILSDQTIIQMIKNSAQ